MRDNKQRSYSGAVARYGRMHLAPPGWPDELKWMIMVTVPAGFGHWINSATGQPTRRIYANKDMRAPLLQALANLQERGLAHELRTFDGCHNIRPVRGSDRVSTHAYGLAVDVNAAENALGHPPRLSAEFVRCWTDAGFDWGGRFSRWDGMHFSYAWEGVRR